MAASRDTKHFEKSPEHLVRVEALLGEGPRTAGMTLVIARDLCRSGHGILRCLEGDQALPPRIEAVKARVLGKEPGDLSSVENPEALDEIAEAVGRP